METLKGLHNLIKRLKWRSPSDSITKLCPKCGSPNIDLSSIFDIWLTPEQYVCKDCGYKGSIVLEIEGRDESEKC